MLDAPVVKLLRWSGRMLGTLLGGIGVFAVWASFYYPPAGAWAFLHLSSATAIAIVLDRDFRLPR